MQPVKVGSLEILAYYKRMDCALCPLFIVIVSPFNDMLSSFNFYF